LIFKKQFLKSLKTERKKDLGIKQKLCKNAWKNGGGGENP